MIRRKFLQLVAIGSAGSLASFDSLATSVPAVKAVYQVHGFSCITCAVGLDTMMLRMKGVITSHSTYPEGKVSVEYDASSVDPASLQRVITEAGFTIAANGSGKP